MKWCIGLILGLCLVFGASVSHGGWVLRINRGATVEDRALADIDSLTFYDAPGSCCALDGTCTVTTQAACSGTWTQGGNCTPSPCPALPPTGMVWIVAGNVRLGQTGIAEPVNDFFVEGFWIDSLEVSNAK
jgi:hypothetical protein